MREGSECQCLMLWTLKKRKPSCFRNYLLVFTVMFLQLTDLNRLPIITTPNPNPSPPNVNLQQMGSFFFFMSGDFLR